MKNRCAAPSTRTQRPPWSVQSSSICAGKQISVIVALGLQVVGNPGIAPPAMRMLKISSWLTLCAWVSPPNLQVTLVVLNTAVCPGCTLYTQTHRVYSSTARTSPHPRTPNTVRVSLRRSFAVGSAPGVAGLRLRTVWSADCSFTIANWRATASKRSASCAAGGAAPLRLAPAPGAAGFRLRTAQQCADRQIKQLGHLAAASRRRATTSLWSIAKGPDIFIKLVFCEYLPFVAKEEIE